MSMRSPRHLYINYFAPIFSKFHMSLQVKEVSWDASLGGHTMDSRLLEYFVDVFNQEIGSGVDIRDSPKALAKLKKQVKRTKEVLSANTEAMLSVEGLYDNRDFRFINRPFTELFLLGLVSNILVYSNELYIHLKHLNENHDFLFFYFVIQDCDYSKEV